MGPSGVCGPGASITPRQLDVLELVAEGCSNNEIAARLFISYRTVRNHLAALTDAFQARNRADLLVKAIKAGLVTVQ